VTRGKVAPRPGSRTDAAPRKRAQYTAGPERRAQIIDATLAILARDGLHGWTTAALARATHLSEAALFKHFGSKDRILAAALEQQADRLHESIRAFHTEETGWRAAAELVRHILRFVEASHGGPLLALVAGPLPPAMRRKAQRSMRIVDAKLRELVPPTGRHGATAADDAAAFAYAIVQSSTLRWLLRETRATPTRIAEPMLVRLERVFG
jgi:AcrR family transcriptional regulator